MRPDLIVQSLRRALGQLTDPKVFGSLLASLAIMLLVTGPFVLVFVIFAWFIELITPESLTLPWLGQVSFLGVLTKGLATKTSWVFWTYVMSPVAVAIIGLFLERIVNAVEQRHYRDLAPARPRGFGETVSYALRFFGVMVLVSLGALIASLFSPILAPVVFVLANGTLIAREYFETVALRRMDERAAKSLAQQHRLTLLGLGSVLALGLAVPFLNLLVPVLGIAAFTHLFHQLRRPPAQAESP